MSGGTIAAPIPPGPAPEPVRQLLAGLARQTVSEETLHVQSSRLSRGELMDLASYFGEDDFSRLF